MLPIQVAIVEDDSQIRDLMRLIIDGSPGFSCYQAFEDCETAIPAFIENTPDLVLMDIDLLKMSGIEGVKILQTKLPNLTVVMLTVHEDNDAVFDSLCAGATGYLVKGLPPVKLLQAIKEAHEGGAPMSASIARKVVHSFRPNKLSPLSEREIEVLNLLCKGENYKTIAAELFVSSNTVKAHIKNIYSKLQVHTRAEAVSLALKHRLTN